MRAIIPTSMNFRIIVVGAGHAGIEASLAAARMGVSTLMLTLNLDHIGQMSCNPAIGGIGKGHLVKEIDALGGEMGRAIDETGIQFRVLNRSKGPAVWSSRAQADRHLYAKRMKQVVENTPMLHVKHGLGEDLLIENNVIVGCKTQNDELIYSKSTVLTTGTFLNGIMHIGDQTTVGGRLNDHTSNGISESLLKYGLGMGRMKTGTVPRLAKKSINYNDLEEQWGDQPIPTFSFYHDSNRIPQISCHITY